MYEYKVVPAPVRAQKVKGLKTTADRFSHALAERINAEAAGGWQYQRSETLTCEERSGLGRIRTTTQTVMIFARALGALRPDAGGALAAAQTAAQNPVRTLAQQAPHAVEIDDQPWGDDRHDPAAFDAYAEPDALPHDPEPADPAPARRGRQEPLFRSSPMLHSDRAARPEPVLRPRAVPRDGDEG